MTTSYPHPIWNSIEKIRFEPTFDRAVQHLKAIGRAIDIPSFAIIPDVSSALPPVVDFCAGEAVASTAYQSYRSRYLERQISSKSPIHNACRLASLPFVWRTDGPWSIPMELERHHRRVLTFFADHGRTGGLSVPVHGPGGRVSSLRFYLINANESEVDLEGVLQQHASALSMVGLYIIDKFWRQTALSTSVPFFTQREHDCLRLAAQGLSDKCIAIRLDVSPTTVRYYMDNAVRKLEATNRVQAVGKAAQFGLLTSTPAR